MNPQVKEALKKLTPLRYAYHFPSDMVALRQHRADVAKIDQYAIEHGIKYGPDLEKFRNMYVGKRCFVIGLGPSLTTNDLDLIQGEISFSVNSCYQLYPNTAWRPTIYVSADPAMPERIKSDGYSFLGDSKYIFLSQFCIADFDLDFARRDNVYFYKRHAVTGAEQIDKEHGKFRFGYDFTKEVDRSGTIIYEVIELALFMGFSEIYLLGVDNSYNYMDRAYAKGIDEPIYDVNTSFWTLCYQWLDRQSKVEGRRIYNAGRGGCLEAFERVDLEKLL